MLAEVPIIDFGGGKCKAQENRYDLDDVSCHKKTRRALELIQVPSTSKGGRHKI